MAIAAGIVHSMALVANGTVIAWGYNASGATNVPPALTDVVAISAGAYHNLARVGSGPPIPGTLVTHPSRSANGFSLVEIGRASCRERV